MARSWLARPPVRRSSTRRERICRLGTFPGRIGVSGPDRGCSALQPAARRCRNSGSAQARSGSFPRRISRNPNRRRRLHLTLSLGYRQFSGLYSSPRFSPFGSMRDRCRCGAQSTGVRDLDRIVFTPLPAVNRESRRISSRLKSAPLAWACISACGAIAAARWLPWDRRRPWPARSSRNMFSKAPSATSRARRSSKDNVNYLAGVHEIGVRSEYTDGRDMPRLMIRSVEFEGPYYESWPPRVASGTSSSIPTARTIRRRTRAKSFASSRRAPTAGRSPPAKKLR